MNNEKTIRLIYPQWQGGDIARWIPEVKNAEDAATGYALGVQLLSFLAPPNRAQDTLTVPVDMGASHRTVQDGVWDRDAIARQTATALQMLRESNPDRIITLGGECSVSVAPFSYLAGKYGDDVAMIWIDAHPDITLPGDAYAGYHAMAVAALMGKGDEKIVSALPSRIDASKILFVGLRDWERDEIKMRQEAYGISHLAPEQTATDSRAVTQWLERCGASKVVIHFDLDVLDPTEIVAAVGQSPDGMTMEAAVRVINDIAAVKDIVGLTVAEAMPRTAIRLRNMLRRLPLF